MKFNDSALILHIKPYGEDSAIVKVFSQNNGLRSGFVKNIYSKNNQNIYQIGNLITADFYYKQPEKNLASFLSTRRQAKRHVFWGLSGVCLKPLL